MILWPSIYDGKQQLLSSIHASKDSTVQAALSVIDISEQFDC